MGRLHRCDARRALTTRIERAMAALKHGSSVRSAPSAFPRPRSMARKEPACGGVRASRSSQGPRWRYASTPTRALGGLGSPPRQARRRASPGWLRSICRAGAGLGPGWRTGSAQPRRCTRAMRRVPHGRAALAALASSRCEAGQRGPRSGQDAHRADQSAAQSGPGDVDPRRRDPRRRNIRAHTRTPVLHASRDGPRTRPVAQRYNRSP